MQEKKHLVYTLEGEFMMTLEEIDLLDLTCPLCFYQGKWYEEEVLWHYDLIEYGGYIYSMDECTYVQIETWQDIDPTHRWVPNRFLTDYQKTE